METKRGVSTGRYAVSGCLLLLGFFCIWGMFGRIPRTVEGAGILVNGGGSLLLYAPVDGIVSDISVRQDMSVQQGDTLARLMTAEGEIVRIRTPDSGRVASLHLQTEQHVQAGDELGRVLIQSDNADFLAVVCYIPLAEADAILPGMEIEVYPAGLNTDNIGHMRALVASRARYPASEADIAYETSNGAIAETLAGTAPVVAVRGVLRKNADSQNTYLWTSRNGEAARISDGMLVRATIITGYDSPFVLVLPFLKALLSGGEA